MVNRSLFVSNFLGNSASLKSEENLACRSLSRSSLHSASASATFQSAGMKRQMLPPAHTAMDGVVMECEI